jgi:ParB-like chromosome segregation protein Spo0J
LVRKAKRVKVLIGKPQQEPPRLPLNPIDEAAKIRRLLEAHGSLERVAQAVGVSRARISQILGLLRLPESIKKRVQDPGDGICFTERELRPIVVLQSPERQLRMFAELLRMKVPEA